MFVPLQKDQKRVWMAADFWAIAMCAAVFRTAPMLPTHPWLHGDRLFQELQAAASAKRAISTVVQCFMRTHFELVIFISNLNNLFLEPCFHWCKRCRTCLLLTSHSSQRFQHLFKHAKTIKAEKMVHFQVDCRKHVVQRSDFVWFHWKQTLQYILRIQLMLFWSHKVPCTVQPLLLSKPVRVSTMEPDWTWLLFNLRSRPAVLN